MLLKGKKLKVKGPLGEPNQCDGDHCQRAVGEHQSWIGLRAAEQIGEGKSPEGLMVRPISNAPSIVGFPTVAHGGNVDTTFFIQNRVNDSIIPDANAPQMLLTSQFSRTRWPRVDGKGFDLGEDAANERRVEDFQFVAR
jgi:hypothetical protein